LSTWVQILPHIVTILGHVASSVTWQ